ncbi:MAG: hypothetical protein AAGE99_01175 [Chlamydiota bacterium]
MDKRIDLRIAVNRKKIGLCVLSLTVVASLFVVRLGVHKGGREKGYRAAKVAFANWEQGSDRGGDDFDKLEKLMKKYPELRPRYEPSIAQSLLATASPQEATPFIERTLRRRWQPYYSDYGQASLKMSQGKYREALNEALSLKTQMLSDPLFREKSVNDSTLFAFNLLRIAILSGQLNRQEPELETWREIKRYGGWGDERSPTNFVDHEGFKQLLNHFSVQETTLLDYIEAREEELKNR